MSVYIAIYAKRMPYSEQPIVLLAQRHPNTMILNNSENLNSILNIFQETHDFLVLTDPVIICICSSKNHRQTFSWPGERPSPHLKVINLWFGLNIKNLSEPFFADICCQEGILFSLKLASKTNQKKNGKDVCAGSILKKRIEQGFYHNLL